MFYLRMQSSCVYNALWVWSAVTSTELWVCDGGGCYWLTDRPVMGPDQWWRADHWDWSPPGHYWSLMAARAGVTTGQYRGRSAECYWPHYRIQSPSGGTEQCTQGIHEYFLRMVKMMWQLPDLMWYLPQWHCARCPVGNEWFWVFVIPWHFEYKTKLFGVIRLFVNDFQLHDFNLAFHDKEPAARERDNFLVFYIFILYFLCVILIMYLSFYRVNICTLTVFISIYYFVILLVKVFFFARI